ncbi:MAG: transposase [Blautia wexlerae]
MISIAFSKPSKLLAFAGLDPSVYQSGNFQARETRMSKRGSRVLTLCPHKCSSQCC